jgi:hypothetical protein
MLSDTLSRVIAIWLATGMAFSCAQCAEADRVNQCVYGGGGAIMAVDGARK